MRDRRIIVAGGGASGLLLARSLLRAGAHVTVIEPRSQLGLGVAYSTQCMQHLLNAPAGKMSALAEEPDHFVAWLMTRGLSAEPKAFVPRALYGAYLQMLADEARLHGGVRLRHLRTRATDATECGDSVHVRCSDGTVVEGAAFVVAIGNAKPSPWPSVPEAIRTSPRFYDSAWIEGATIPRVEDETVVLLGTGLTAVDAVLGLREKGHGGPIVMISRRGLLPHEHRLFDTPPVASRDAKTIGDVIAAIRRTGGSVDADWRLTLDGLRSETNTRWEALSFEDQRRFMRHVLPYWNVHRHRMAPQAAKEIAALLADGTLRMIAGRTGTLEATQASVRIPVALRGNDTIEVVEAGRVINCSGPEHDVSKRNNPLIRSLLGRRAMVPHPLRIGARIARDGALIDATGASSTRLFAIGPVRFGTLIETTAIPEIREQVRELTAVLIGRNVPGVAEVAGS